MFLIDFSPLSMLRERSLMNSINITCSMILRILTPLSLPHNVRPPPPPENIRSGLCPTDFVMNAPLHRKDATFQTSSGWLQGTRDKMGFYYFWDFTTSLDKWHFVQVVLSFYWKWDFFTFQGPKTLWTDDLIKLWIFYKNCFLLKNCHAFLHKLAFQ